MRSKIDEPRVFSQSTRSLAIQPSRTREPFASTGSPPGDDPAEMLPRSGRARPCPKRSRAARRLRSATRRWFPLMPSDRRRGDVGQPAPRVADAPLQSSKLAGEKHPGLFPVEAVEELLRCPTRLVLQPLDDARPPRLERSRRVRQCRGGRWCPTCRPHLAGAPCEREARQEPLRSGVALRHRMDGRPRGQGGEMVLRARISPNGASGSTVPRTARNRPVVASGIAADANSRVHGVSGAR